MNTLNTFATFRSWYSHKLGYAIGLIPLVWLAPTAIVRGVAQAIRLGRKCRKITKARKEDVEKN
jgi:hypothetical protein